MNQLWISERKGIGVTLSTEQEGQVKFEVRQFNGKEKIGEGTVRNGSVTCPACGMTISASHYRSLATGGRLSEVMYAVVLRNADGTRKYRSAKPGDFEAYSRAQSMVLDLSQETIDGLVIVPSEALSADEPRRLNVRLYGFTRWNQLFNDRQKLALVTFQRLLHECNSIIAGIGHGEDLASALVTVLALQVSNIVHYNCNMSTYLSDGMISAFIQGSAIPMRADYAEANPVMDNLVGGFQFQLDRSIRSPSTRRRGLLRFWQRRTVFGYRSVPTAWFDRCVGD
ncbi:MAG: hypothetical protein V9H69_17600 [Anaerolineae bacterium]